MDGVVVDLVRGGHVPGGDEVGGVGYRRLVVGGFTVYYIYN